MPLDPATGQLVAQGVIAASQAIARGGPRRQYKWNKRAMYDANALNRENATWTLEQNRKIQNEQRVYDSPEEQMKRYKAAGLNPNMIYGSGSSAGAAFPIAAGGIGPARLDAPVASYGDPAGAFLQAGQAMAQTSLTRQKEEESEQKVILMDAQADVAKSNPMLNPHVYRATVFQLEAAANLKAQQDRFMSSFQDGSNLSRSEYMLDRGMQKVEQDIIKGLQEIGIKGTAAEIQQMDKAIKNQILQSKEYENMLKKIQVDWMKDGDITPQHILQGIMLLLQKMM